MNGIKKFSILEDEMLNSLVEAIYDSELIYSSIDLYSLGIESPNEIDAAVMSAIQTIRRADLSPQQHFKYIYLTDIKSGNILHDWRMSKMGFLLTLLNANTTNSLINQLKIELINRII